MRACCLQVWDAVDWLQSHDAEAQRMGQAAREFALQYLSVQARTCYWYTLLNRYAPLLRYSVAAKYNGTGSDELDITNLSSAWWNVSAHQGAWRMELRKYLATAGEVGDQRMDASCSSGARMLCHVAPACCFASAGCGC